MDARFEQQFLTSADMRRVVCQTDGSLLWVAQDDGSWFLRHDDSLLLKLPVDGDIDDVSLVADDEWLCVLARRGSITLLYRLPLRAIIAGDVSKDWKEFSHVPHGVVGWLEGAPVGLAAVLVGTSDGTRIDLGRIEPDGSWYPITEHPAPGALAPTAVRAIDGVHVSWCDVGRRLWYGRVAADLSGWDRPPAVLQVAARQPALGASDDDVLLVFESDDGDIGYALLRDGVVESLHEAIIARGSTSPLRRDVKGCPRLQTDADGDLWLWMIDNTRRAVAGCCWLGAGWGQVLPRGRLAVPALRGDHTRTGIDRIDVPGRTYGWPTQMLAQAEVPSSFSRQLTVAHALRPLQQGSKLLFVDDRLMARANGLTRVPEAARPFDGNPVLDLGAPGHFDCERVFDSGTVLYDEGCYRMWYAARGALDTDPRWWRSTKLGYAESDDGFAWRRVDCGRQPAPDSNLLPEMRSYMVGVARDDTDPDPHRRYKQLEVFNIVHERELIADGTLTPGGGGYHGRLWTSADGLAWCAQPIRVRRGAAQYRSVVPTCLLIDPDDAQRRYKAYCYTSLTRASRAVALLTSADGIDWRFDEANPVIDPEDRGEPWQPAGPVSHVHDAVVFRAGGDYLAIYQYIRHPIRLDLELASSDSGVDFRCPFPDHAVIPRGGAGRWDRGIMSPSAPVTTAGRTLLYYGATDYGHESDEPLDPTRERNLAFRPGVAEMRVDGWACLQLQPNVGEGTMTSVPLTADAALQLGLNADCRGGRVLVQVVDAQDGAPVNGMSFGACRALDSDGLELQPTWRDSDGRLPQGRPIRVQLQLTRGSTSPRVYALLLK